LRAKFKTFAIKKVKCHTGVGWGQKNPQKMSRIISSRLNRKDVLNIFV